MAAVSNYCYGMLPPEEFFDYGLYYPDPVFRKESDASTISEDMIESDLDSQAAAERAAELAAEEERRRREEEANKNKPAASAIQKAFQAASGGQKTMSVEKAAMVARQLGAAPAEEDILELKATTGGSVKEEDLKLWIDEMALKYNDSEEDLIRFFSHFDINASGTMSRGQIYNILGSFGEPLTRQEIDAILAEFNMGGDNINYVEFVHKLLQK